MAAGVCVVVNDHPPNLECIGDAGISFSGKLGAVDLRDKLKSLLDSPSLVEELGRKAKERIRKEYSWERVADLYEALCFRYGKSRS